VDTLFKETTLTSPSRHLACALLGLRFELEQLMRDPKIKETANSLLPDVPAC
jgi:hypothetical protein